MTHAVLTADRELCSPYALSAFVALREKKLPFILQTYDLAAGEQAGPDVAATSLTARVPALTLDGFSLSESSAIAEYLDERYPPPAHAPLYPLDLLERARVRQVQAWLRSDLMALRVERPTTVIFYGTRRTPLSDAGQRAAAKLARVGEALLANGSALIARCWSIADVDLALMIQRLLLHGDAVSDPLRRYADAQWQRPDVQEWLGLERPALRP